MVARPVELTTTELAARCRDSNHAVVDVRPRAAYNGWRLRDEPRGGHVPGATSVPLRAVRGRDWQSLLGEREIQPEQPVTLYGYDAADARQASATLAELGYEASVYTRFLDEWASDPDRPLERLARYEQLVSPEWVRELTRGGNPPADPDGEYVVCHVHGDERADYEAGHVPGAIPLNTTSLESPEDWNRRSPEELATALRNHGIRHDTTVVLYGRPVDDQCGDGGTGGTTPGHLGAMRCAVLMLYAGVEDVRVLDGGLAAWRAAEQDVSTADVEPDPVESFGVEVPARPGLCIDTPDAKALLAADDAELVSVRSRAELVGETSGYDYIDETGRIPGAVFVDSGSDADHVEALRNVDETMREARQVAATWAEKGIRPDKRVAFYCGTGWRASEAFMHAYLMGWPNAAVYDGGWYEWSSDPDNPIEVGPPPDLEAD